MHGEATGSPAWPDDPPPPPLHSMALVTLFASLARQSVRCPGANDANLPRASDISNTRRYLETRDPTPPPQPRPVHCDGPNVLDTVMGSLLWNMKRCSSIVYFADLVILLSSSLISRKYDPPKKVLLFISPKMLISTRPSSQCSKLMWRDSCLIHELSDVIYSKKTIQKWVT